MAVDRAFGGSIWERNEIKLFARHRAEQTLHLSPVLISEGVTLMEIPQGNTMETSGK